MDADVRHTPSELRALRAASNQVLFREVNERLEEIAEAFQLVAERATFACECYDLACIEQVTLTVAEYERVRAHPTHFVVLPGHVLPDVEDVVATHDQYVVVAKRGVAASVAATADPRRRADA